MGLFQVVSLAELVPFKMEESTAPEVANGASSLSQTGPLFSTFDGSAKTTQGPTSDHIRETTSVLLTQQLC